MNNVQLNSNAAQTINTSKEDRHMTDIIISDKTAGIASRILMRRYDGPTFDWLKCNFVLRLTAYTKDGFNLKISISLNQCYKLVVAGDYIEIEFPYYEKKILQDLRFNATDIMHLTLITCYPQLVKTDIAHKCVEIAEEADVRYVEEKHLKDIDADLDIYRLAFHLKDETANKQEGAEDEQTVST